MFRYLLSPLLSKGPHSRQRLLLSLTEFVPSHPDVSSLAPMPAASHLTADGQRLSDTGVSPYSLTGAVGDLTYHKYRNLGQAWLDASTRMTGRGGGH